MKKVLKELKNRSEDIHEKLNDIYAGEEKESEELQKVRNILLRLENENWSDKNQDQRNEIIKAEIDDLERAADILEKVVEGLEEISEGFVEIIEELETNLNDGIEVYSLLDSGDMEIKTGEELDYYSRSMEETLNDKEKMENEIENLEKESEYARREVEKFSSILGELGRHGGETIQQRVNELQQKVSQIDTVLERDVEGRIETEKEEIRNEVERRDFLRIAGSGASAALLGLSGCTGLQNVENHRSTPTPNTTETKRKSDNNEESERHAKKNEIIDLYNSGVSEFNQGMETYDSSGQARKNDEISRAINLAEQAVENFGKSEEHFREGIEIAEKLENREAAEILERGMKKSEYMKEAAILMTETLETYSTGNEQKRKNKYEKYREKINKANNIKPPKGENLEKALTNE